MGILKVIRASVMPLDYGGSKPHENTVGTQIRTQIIAISHYEYTSLQPSQFGTNHSKLGQLDKSRQLPKITIRRR